MLFHIKSHKAVIAVNHTDDIFSTKCAEFFTKELVPPESGVRILASSLARP